MESDIISDTFLNILLYIRFKLQEIKFFNVVQRVVAVAY